MRERSPTSGLPRVTAGGEGVGEAPPGGLGALNMGNWAHIRAARNTSNSCIHMWVSREERGGIRVLFAECAKRVLLSPRL